ncbi:uncharacterized protein LOC132204255 [Neocloeon triangulifer]|uniref:uncharacterized protein LOC132204255 n=1 Tax=Neocloeon triangulifer TaxID=2078957 RepID=UPI00286F5FBA|nr:uncharacterized protein LOC132204255 [Neocloeon triangulifer]
MNNMISANQLFAGCKKRAQQFLSMSQNFIITTTKDMPKHAEKYNMYLKSYRICDLEPETLRKLARIKRSKLRNLRQLKEQAMEKLLASDACGKTTLLSVSPLLQQEIQSHVEMHLRGSYKYDQTLEMAKWMLKFAGRVFLNDHTKEFDFAIIRSYHNLEEQMWNLLVERCPNLERITDNLGSKIRTFKSVLPYLKRFPKLEHISLEGYQCTADDLTRISQIFPNLHSLSATFDFVDDNILRALFALQRLESLDIVWDDWDVGMIENDAFREEQTHYLDFFKAECLAHLPHLQYLSGGRVFHNHRPICTTNRKLSLREMEIVDAFDYDLVPCVEKLFISGPLLLHRQSFNGLSNLRSLTLTDVKDQDLCEVLADCGGKLEELAVKDKYLVVDPYELLAKCPHLRKFDVSCKMSFEDSSYSVTANHFQFIQTFKYKNSDETNNSPPYLLPLVLTAPNVEEISMSKDCIPSADLLLLTQQLVEGRILQKVKKIEYKISGKPRSEFVQFVRLLPVCAPRLEVVKSNGK